MIARGLLAAGWVAGWLAGWLLAGGRRGGVFTHWGDRRTEEAGRSGGVEE
jgi:hypothetical protein